MRRTSVIDLPAEYISRNHLQMVTKHLSLNILHASPMLMLAVVRSSFLSSKMKDRKNEIVSGG